MKVKSLAADLAKFDVSKSERTITSYFSIFGNRDRVGDVVEPGAFKRTIAERFPKGLIKLFYNHSTNIGRIVNIGEDSTGAFYVGRVSKIQKGDELLELVADGAVTHNSFAYDVINSRPVKAADGYVETHLTELRLGECGPVDFPANELAGGISLKALPYSHRYRKDLHELADVLCTVQYLRDRMAGMRLSPEDADYVRQLIGELEATQSDLGDLIPEPGDAPAQPETPDPSAMPGMASAPAAAHAKADAIAVAPAALNLGPLVAAFEERTKRLLKLRN